MYIYLFDSLAWNRGGGKEEINMRQVRQALKCSWKVVYTMRENSYKIMNIHKEEWMCFWELHDHKST